MTANVRVAAKLNNFLDSVVDTLKTISKRKNPAFLSSPKSVKRLMLAGDFAGKEKPFLTVHVVDWTATPSGFQRFDGELRFGVNCVVGDLADDAEKALLELVSDVILAVSSDVTFEGQVFYCFPESFEPNVDLMRRSGLAITTVVFKVSYRFDWFSP